MKWSHKGIGKAYYIGIGVDLDRHGNPATANYAEYLGKQGVARDILDSRFGGHTMVATQGGWHDDETGIDHREGGITFIVITDQTGDVVCQAAADIAALFNQAAAVVTYPNGRAALIRPAYDEDYPSCVRTGKADRREDMGRRGPGTGVRFAELFPDRDERKPGQRRSGWYGQKDNGGRRGRRA